MASNSFGLQVGNMAKIFYIHIKDEDSAQGYFFNNKRKAQEKGMELYDDFSFDLEGEEFEGDFGTQWIYSGIQNVKEGFLFYQEDAMMYLDDMSEEQARSAAEQFEGAGAYFPAKLKGGYGECYIGSATEHTNGLWSFEYGDIYEKKQTTMRHIPTFESFVNEFQKGKWVDKMDQIGKKLEKDYDKIEYDKYDVRITLPTKETGLTKYKDKEFEFYWDGNSARAEGDKGTYVQYLGFVKELDKWIDSFTNKKVWSKPAK